MQLKLLATDTMQIERTALAAEFQGATGRALRRTGVLPALALLSCLRCTQGERWTTPRQPLPTVLLWHTRSVIAEEATPLMRMMLVAQEALMPYDFLASQPALMGVTLHGHFPELSQAICLPWVEEDGGDIWPRTLLLAAHWLHDRACQRVICLQLDRNSEHLQTQALSLSLGTSGPQALATLQVDTTPITSQRADASQDFISRLQHWLRSPGQPAPQMDGSAITIQASLELPF